MPRVRRTTNRIMLLVAMGVVGLLLLYLPNLVMQQYRSAKELGSVWGTAYLATVGLGGLLFGGVSVWTVWTLWRNTLRKRQRNTQRALNPSQMSEFTIY